MVINIEKIKEQLQTMRKKAYSPYYRFTVGAVLVAKSGKLYTGCNIDNITQGPGICAERVAFGKAISEGEREFDCIYIIGGPIGKHSVLLTPCGVCRQFLVEFCKPDFKVINFYGKELEQRAFLLKELLPESFASLD